MLMKVKTINIDYLRFKKFIIFLKIDEIVFAHIVM